MFFQATPFGVATPGLRTASLVGRLRCSLLVTGVFWLDFVHFPGKTVPYTHIVQFEVQPAGVADWIAVVVSSPQGRCGGVAVGTHDS